MKLDFLDLNDLHISPLNVRKHGEVNGDDLIPSIKVNGVIQPLLVRSNPNGFEVIAGQRRLKACQTIAETETIEPIPCAIMAEGDDAKAIEASLAENIARLPMDEIDQYEAFLALTKEGRSVDDIAAHFGVTERLVKQRLAIANLYTPILNAYRREEVQPSTIRILTMASVKQQKAWFKLFKEGNDPYSGGLRNWLFGGETIPTDNALFALETYQGAITTDLFGEGSYFSDPSLFWEYQSRAIAETIKDLEDDGWSEVILLDVGASWNRWEYSKVNKEDGGKVYIQARSDGEVAIHEGLLPEKEAKRLALAAKGEEAPKTERPELTQAMQSYLDHHRHAAVCGELQRNPGIAMRLMLTQLISRTECRPRKPRSEATAASLETNKATIARNEKRDEVWATLGIADTLKEFDYSGLTYGHLSHVGLNERAFFAKLMTLSDEDITDLIAFFASESLWSGDPLVEHLGVTLNVDMSSAWTPDDTFFDLLRDKEATNAILADVAGENVAKGNLTSTAKTQKQIIRDCIKGKNGRDSQPNWQPRYMAFPMTGYTKRQDTIKAVEVGKELTAM